MEGVIIRFPKNRIATWVIYCLPIIFTLFGISTLSKIFLICVFLCVVLFEGIDCAVCAYVYMVFFVSITKGESFTAVAYLGIILCIKIIIDQGIGSLKVSEVGMLILISIYAIRSWVAGNGISQISMIYDLVIAIWIRHRTHHEHREDVDQFWKMFYKTIFLAALMSMLCGLIKYTGGVRFAIPLGTDTACLILVAGMIFPLFYFKNTFLKILSLCFLLTGIFMTVSMTALLCLGTFFAIYLFYVLLNKKEVSMKRKIVIIGLAIIFVIYLLVSWNYGSGITIVDNVINRAKIIIVQISNNELSRATTGRFDIYKLYLEYFNSFSLPKKLFGGGSISYIGQAYYRNYSHNSLIDAIMFLGLIPLFIYIIWVIKGVCRIKEEKHQLKLLLLKFAIFVTSMSVSIFSSSFCYPFMMI